jgi:hypothetical protein
MDDLRGNSPVRAAQSGYLASSRNRFLTMPARAAAAGLVAMLMSLGIAPIASAAGTLDQSQPMFNCGAIGVSQTDWIAQTFTAGITGMLDQVDLHLKVQNGNPGPLTVQIRTVLPDGTPSAVVLATATVPQANVPTPSQLSAFVAVPLSPPAPSVAGTQYAIVLSTTGTPQDFYYWSLGGLGSATQCTYTGDVYPGGITLASTNSGSTWAVQPSVQDLAFKTYVSTNPAVVPEATSALLLPIAGLVVLGSGFVLTRKQRRASALV